VKELFTAELSKKEKTFIVFYFLFLLGYFVNFNHDHHYVVYGLLLTSGFTALWESRREFLISAPLNCACIFLLYIVSSYLWSGPDKTKSMLEVISKAALTYSFVVMTAYLVWKHYDQFFNVLRAMVVCVAVIGIISVILFYSSHPFPEERLVSFGQLNNPGLMGSVNGVFAVIASYFAIASKATKSRLYFSCVFLIMFSVVAMSQARSAFIAMVAGFMVLVLFQHRARWIRFDILLCVALGAYIFGGGIFSRFLTAGIDYSSDLRIQIWQDAISQIAAHPILGYGIAARMQFSTTGGFFFHPHSVYLSVTWYAGFLGLLLMVGMLVLACRESILEGRRNGNYLALALLVYTCICVFVDYGDVIAYPHDIWLQFWLSIAIACGLGIRRKYGGPGFRGLKT
jgi:O-antigen ligase